jgi:hypothetical protein
LLELVGCKDTWGDVDAVKNAVRKIDIKDAAKLHSLQQFIFSLLE